MMKDGQGALLCQNDNGAWGVDKWNSYVVPVLLVLLFFFTCYSLLPMAAPHLLDM
jgi:hypothetical protein